MVPFDPDKVPLLGKNVHDFLKENYTSPVLRALAMGPTGGWSYTGDGNEEMSARRALQTCGFSEHTPCTIVAMGNRFTVGIPTTVEVTGWLQLGQVQMLSDEDKAYIAKQYTLDPDWRALAVADNGKYGLATKQTSEVAAISAARLACTSAGGVGCGIYAVGPYRVKPKVDHTVP
jgi:adenylate cyclase